VSNLQAPPLGKVLSATLRLRRSRVVVSFPPDDGHMHVEFAGFEWL
jgi:hypothetical protein